MSPAAVRRRTTALTLLTLIAGLAGCASDSVFTPPGGPAGNLTTLNSSPADGDAVYASPMVFHDPNFGGSGLDAVFVSETVGATGHEIGVHFDPATGGVDRVEHFWGPGSTLSGSTACAAPGSPCDPARVVVDTVARTITFDDLVLADSTGGTATSTIDGAVAW